MNLSVHICVQKGKMTMKRILDIKTKLIENIHANGDGKSCSGLLALFYTVVSVCAVALTHGETSLKL